MAINFPSSPSVNQTFTEGSITYKWDGAKWIGLGVTPADRLVEGSNSLEITSGNDLVWTGDNVGVGVTNPGERLHLTTTSGNCKLRIDAASAASVDFYNAGTRFSDMFTDASTGNFTITNRQNADIIVRTNGTNERLRVTSAGTVKIGSSTLVTPSTDADNFVIDTGDADSGLSILSSTTGRIYFGDASNNDTGSIRYVHTDNSMRFETNDTEKLRIAHTTASVSSAGSGANGIGCFGINDTSPDSNALALSMRGTYGMEDPRPLVYLQRSYGVGGGSGTDEITLEIDAPGSYNSAGVVYGIKSRVQHNLNGSHYAGHFENNGSQYSANGTSALYAKTTKLDTNGSGDVIAFRADASITTGSTNSGAAIAGYFASGNNVNGKPMVCQNGYTTNSYSNQIIFRKHNGSGVVEVGSIKSNNTATQYNTSSDYRLKENIVSLTGAIDRLKQLQPKRFNFIGVDETIDGFIAHEVNPVAPYAVSGEKDAVKKELVLDEDGKEQFDENGEIIDREVIDPQSVDYSKLTTLTIAALQEAITKIETLETQLTDALARITALEG